MPPSGVRLVCSSISPVMAPASSVITPPVVETKVDRRERLVPSLPKSAGPTRSEHLSERRFRAAVYGGVPVRLYPEPPPRVLAPVVVVRWVPCLRAFVPLRTVL